MSKHLIKIDNPQHCAISVAHAGLDNQYCDAGEVVAIDWQPSAGWGLQEAHYTDEDGNVVAIDLTLREFTMPAKAITIGGTAKRFVVQDWTAGTSDQINNEDPCVFVQFHNGEPTPVTVDVLAGAIINGDNNIAAKEVVVEVSDAAASITPQDNTIYNCGELTSLDITLPSEFGVDFMSQINFTSGATATTVTDDGDINWLGDDIDNSGLFVPATSKRYVVMLYQDGVDMRGVVMATTPLA